MTKNVTIKSFPNGIKIILMPDISFQQLKKECSDCFSDAANFFKDAKLAVSFEGRNLTVQEEIELVQVIQSSCNIQVLCLVGKDDETNQIFKNLTQSSKEQEKIPCCQFFKGTLSEGEVFETNESIIILGDVLNNASVISKKDIIVLGNLYGDVYAGADGQNHFVAALHFNPHNLKIGDFTYQKPNSGKKWGIKQKQKTEPMMAYLSDDSIQTKEIQFTEELLEQLYHE